MKRMNVRRVLITEARVSLRKLARRIHEKKSYLILEDRGEPVGGIIGIYTSLAASAAHDFSRVF